MKERHSVDGYGTVAGASFITLRSNSDVFGNCFPARLFLTATGRHKGGFQFRCDRTMNTFSKMLIAAAAFLTTGASSALAQDVDAQSSYQVSELRTSAVPVPTTRPVVASVASGQDQQPIQVADIKRTVGGIRIVGPTFFPKD